MALYAEDAVKYVHDVMIGTERANAVRLGAAKLILNKTLPDLKQTELSGNPERPIGVVILPPVKIDESGDNLETAPRPATGSVSTA